jgi:hypothetical protein
MVVTFKLLVHLISTKRARRVNSHLLVSNNIYSVSKSSPFVIPSQFQMKSRPSSAFLKPFVVALLLQVKCMIILDWELHLPFETFMAILRVVFAMLQFKLFLHINFKWNPLPHSFYLISHAYLLQHHSTT